MRQATSTIVLTALALCLTAGSSVPRAQATKPAATPKAAPYQFMVPGSEVDKKAAAIVAQMTLPEKVGQMIQVDHPALASKDDITKYFLGSLLSGGSSEPPDVSPKGWSTFVDDYQTYALKTRLRIPLIYGIDAVHGHNNVNGAVIFPHNIGLGATRNAALVEKTARVSAEETAATNTLWTFAPGLIVARDERWGRTYESFSEDPALVAELGAAATRGWQSAKLANSSAVLACIKHYLGDGGTQNGKDQGNMVADDATMRRLFLAPYLDSIKAGAGSLMVSYSSWNGTKMHGNKYLLTDVLKGELGFRGFIVSDYAAINQLPGATFAEQIALSVNAGLDMAMIPDGPGKPKNYVEFFDTLIKLVNEGKVPMSRIDDAVLRIMRIKIEMNLDGRTKTDPALLAKVGSPEHRAVGREAVRQSLVVLKNDNKALPITSAAKRIHVIGTAAHDMSVQCGGWTIGWQKLDLPTLTGATTILDGLKRGVAAGTQVTWDADGAGVAGADAVVVVVGEKPYAEMMGDRPDLSLPAETAGLLKQARTAGKPVTFVLLSGRPMILGDALAQSDAVVAAWLPGSEGDGVADVLLGKFAPVGKTPMSWPRTMAQVPINIGDANYDPLFKVGYGLTFPAVKK